MLALLDPAECAALRAALDKILAWIGSGFREEIDGRYPEAARPTSPSCRPRTPPRAAKASGA